ncbi:hypothetical protein JRQ81_006948 [Phrynocephalus forsythii]|uniref:Uncharacterized protein n=1 Tax=Phrynocephalus forsythii TaxID=171643 RepID=A0A9Q0XE36_9SAUR|nr:hypothetical protein JRQ81_006948 [Phrynocephalus forsythii]
MEGGNWIGFGEVTTLLAWRLSARGHLPDSACTLFCPGFLPNCSSLWASWIPPPPARAAALLQGPVIMRPPGRWGRCGKCRTLVLLRDA